MRLYPAEHKDASLIQHLVHHTIKSVYPLYYPDAVVEFFLNHHSEKSLQEALDSEYILLAELNGVVVGTGSVKGNEIKRMFILPDFQGLGIGSSLLSSLGTHCKEDGFSSLHLDASLPGFSLYEKLGFSPIAYKKIETPDHHFLCYFEMEKIIL